MSHLLHVARLKSKAVQRGATPLMLEYRVTPETAPYLVSSTSSVMWIPEPHPGDLVKAAVREVKPGPFFLEVVEAVAAMGRQAEWGNVHPLTEEGLRAAIAHVESYDLTELELLVPRRHPLREEPEVEEGDGNDDADQDTPEEVPSPITTLVQGLQLPIRPSSWLPPDCVVVVPQDRTYVGVLNLVTPKTLAAVVHNAARGIGVAQGFGG